MIGSCPMWLWSCCKVTEVWSSSAAVRYCDMQTVCNFFASSRLYCYVEINRGLVRYWSLMSDSISGPWKWMCLPYHFSYFVLVRMMEIPAQWNRPHWDSSGLLGKSMSEDKWLVEKEAGAKKDVWFVTQNCWDYGSRTCTIMGIPGRGRFGRPKDLCYVMMTILSSFCKSLASKRALS
jgi:hypothetical protein